MPFFWIIGSAIAATLGFLLWLLSPVFAGDPQETLDLKILVPGLLVVLGWFVTFLLQENRRQRERGEKQKDICLALRAEIWDFVAGYRHANTQEYGDQIVQNILAAGDNVSDKYHPFVPREKVPIVFSTLAQSIVLLPVKTVSEVVQFYSQLQDLSTFADDLRSEKMAKLPKARRAIAYSDYIEMKKTAYRLGVIAHQALEDSLGIRPISITDSDLLSQKNALRLWINSQAAGQGDQE